MNTGRAVSDLIMATLPKAPADPYEYVMWCEAMAEQCVAFSKRYTALAKQEMTRIKEDGLTSDKYEYVDCPMEPKRSADRDKLAAELPKVYEKIAHVPAAYAAELIGPNKLWKLAAKQAGYDPTREVITLTDLQRELGKTRSEAYIKVIFDAKSPGIYPKGSYRDPRDSPELTQKSPKALPEAKE